MKITFERNEIMAGLEWYYNLFMDMHAMFPESGEKKNLLKVAEDLNTTSWKDICDVIKDGRLDTGSSVAWDDFSITIALKEEMVIDFIKMHSTREVAKGATAMFYFFCMMDTIGSQKIKALFNAIKAIIQAFDIGKGYAAFEMLKSIDLEQMKVDIAAVHAKWNTPA